uniref:SPG11 vesicle trafficking associated, spatacsin n=1 Tax=Scophthalmus maximus TaxID=52904 RepID=A0A8D2ZD33_SCOMX
MEAAAQRPERSPVAVAVIPQNQNCAAVADIRRAEFAPGGSLLGCLVGAPGRLVVGAPGRLVVGAPGRLVVWDPADREAPPAAADGCCTDFSWEEEDGDEEEEVSVHSRGVSGCRLVAVGRQCDLKLLQVEAERSTSISLLHVADCPAGLLQRSVQQQDHGVCELRSLRVLSFAAGRCCVLLDDDWLLRLRWRQAEAEPQILSCCSIRPTDGDRHSAVHHCVCRDTLFTLSSDGIISLYDITDGRLLATVDLPAYLSAGLFEDHVVSTFPSSSPFCLLQVSADLSTAVAVTESHAAVAVDLDHYFRLYPDHMLCAARPALPALGPQQQLGDQDGLSSSGCCLAALGSTFSTDRSWGARLASMYSRAQQAPPPSSQPARASWSSSLPHLESHQAPSSTHSRVPCGGATVDFSFVPESSASSLLAVSDFSALLTFVSPGNRQTTVVSWDFESGSVSYHQAEGEAAPLQRCGEAQHRLLLKRDGVFQVLFSVSQQDLLSRLMLFGSAATVDTVCHLNSWGRCSIPIHALQAGLKNRQLDTVDFYLKSKENVLNPATTKTFSAADQPTSSHAQSPQKFFLILSVQELCPALDLLCSAVRDSNSEAQSRQFSEQLLNITVNFVNTQIRSVLSNSHSDEDGGVRSCVGVLDRYVTELRSYMKRFPWPAGGDTTDSAAQTQREEPGDEWEELPTEELVRQSILTNQMPRAQAVLRRRSRPEQQLSALRTEGLRQVFSRLQQRDLQTADTLLVNMVRTRHCGDPSTNQTPLVLADLLLPRAVQMVRREAGAGEEVLGELVGPRRSDSDEDGGLWQNLRLDWVRNWDQSCQTDVLLSRLQHTGSTLSSCDAAVLWRYLTALHNQHRVITWIQNRETTGAPQWPELAAELVNDDTLCSTFMRENILDLLARYIKLLEKLDVVPLRDLSCIVELLVAAHDCFSLTCNMEGIVRVLQAARHLSHAYLAPGEHYSLMVRLLTGIGRYNEMTYVFDLLHHNHRFEMLLRKKSCSLKTALLDYIKRCLPADSEKHNMVALCFSMRREIGENHEMAARTQLKIIESQAWVVTPDLKSSLVKVLGLLKDAAESFSKDSCVRQATRCVRTAKLVALQLHFLNQGSDVRVINLRPEELLSAVVTLPRCYQVLVVSEAYGFSPDWAEVLFQKVVLGGDFVYLEELKRHRPLTSGLFEDIFKKLDAAPGSAAPNVRRLLTHCDDVYGRYRLAYQHDLYDVTKTLLQDAKTSNYLNDRLAS